jgi:hypothetical protein
MQKGRAEIRGRVTGAQVPEVHEHRVSAECTGPGDG